MGLEEGLSYGERWGYPMGEWLSHGGGAILSIMSLFPVVQALADSKHMVFFETSSKADINVKQLFNMIGSELVKEEPPVAPTQTIKLEIQQPQPRPKWRARCSK